MPYGTLAHAAGRLPLDQLTSALSAYGLDFVQLALAKALDGIDTGPGRLSAGLAHHIAGQFAKHGIRIGALGCYINPVHPDPDQRKQQISRFKEHIRHARDFGASIVATETGHLTTYASQYPEGYVEIGWRTLLDTVRELTEEADKWGVCIGLEPVSYHTLSSPERMLELMEEIPTSAIGVVMDPCNLLSPDTLEKQDEIIDRAFQLWGDRIVLAHLKDVNLREGNLVAGKPGSGVFHADRFLRQLMKRKPHLDISLENTPSADLAGTLAYVKQLGKETAE